MNTNFYIVYSVLRQKDNKNGYLNTQFTCKYVNVYAMKSKKKILKSNENVYARFTSQSLILVFDMTNTFRLDNNVKRVCNYNFFLLYLIKSRSFLQRTFS